MILLFSLLHVHALSGKATVQQSSKNTIFADLFLKNGKSAGAILFFSVILVISGFPPISNIPAIAQSLTNPLYICIKSVSYLIVLVKINQGDGKDSLNKILAPVIALESTTLGAEKTRSRDQLNKP